MRLQTFSLKFFGFYWIKDTVCKTIAKCQVDTATNEISMRMTSLTRSAVFQVSPDVVFLKILVPKAWYGLYEAFGHMDTTHFNSSKIGSKNNVLRFCETWNCVFKEQIYNLRLLLPPEISVFGTFRLVSSSLHVKRACDLQSAWLISLARFAAMCVFFAKVSNFLQMHLLKQAIG